MVKGVTGANAQPLCLLTEQSFLPQPKKPLSGGFAQPATAKAILCN